MVQKVARRRVGTIVVVATIVALAWPAAAPAQEPPRLSEYVDVFSSQTPGTATGRLTRTNIDNPRDPNGKPPAFSRVVVDFHPGTRFDTSAIAQCRASDAELAASGPGACPRGSVVGDGRVDVDTGFPGSLRIVVNDVTLLNAPGELILLFKPRDSGGHVPVRGKLSGSRLEVDSPPLPGAPPDGGASTREILNLQARAGYMTTPPSCPESGTWTNRVTYTFRDGVVQSFTSASPCRPGPAGGAGGRARRDNKRPRVSIRGVPRRRCARDVFSARVRIGERWSGLRRARVSLDGKRVRTTRRTRFRQRIRPRRLRSGRHSLSVEAVDRAGNRSIRRARFRTCRA